MREVSTALHALSTLHLCATERVTRFGGIGESRNALTRSAIGLPPHFPRGGGSRVAYFHATSRRFLANVTYIWLFLIMSGRAGAVDLWSASPYQVRVWLALEATPELIQGWSEEIPRVLTQATEATFGAAWSLAIESAPDALRSDLAQDVHRLTVEQIEQLDALILEGDKLIVVGVHSMGGGVRLQVRELDCRSRSWQVTRVSSVRQATRVGRALGDEVIEAFTPIGLVGRSNEDQVDVTMRAGLLAGNSEERRLMPPVGSIFRAVMRKNDRLGKLTPHGLQDIPWTLLLAEDQNELGIIGCQVISGMRGPFRSRSNRQIDKIALLVKPTFDETRLMLRSKDDPKVALTGYDVHYRLPEEKSTTFIGRSDWRGQVVVRRDDHPIKIMYVKNGDRILARLPIVPGFELEASAEMADDSQRLEAEGFLTGVQEQMIEVKARQQVYAIRIRRAIEVKEIEKASTLLDELRSLPTKEDLVRNMRDRQQSLSSDNRAMQERIDRMFRDTRTLIQTHLTASEADTLRQELSAAQAK